MVTVISVVLFSTFAFLSLMHFYWSFGGRWGSQAVFPTKDDSIKPQMPGIIPTLVVAFGLLIIAIFILQKGGYFKLPIPSFLDQYGLWALAVVFMIRAIGEFNYVGFFKKIKHNKFGINDTKYYSPLCLTIVILIVIMIRYQ